MYYYTALFLAKIIGPSLVIVAAGFIFNRKTYRKVIEDFYKNAALIYVSGLFTLILGLLMVLSYNVWEADWTTIITVLGWLALIKGAWLVIFPDNLEKITKAYQKNASLLTVHLVVLLGLGIFIAYKGYSG